LLKHIDKLQKSLPKLNIKSREIFKALTEKLGIDKQVCIDRLNELISGLEKITNYFIYRAIEKNELSTTPPTPPLN